MNLKQPKVYFEKTTKEGLDKSHLEDLERLAL